MARSTTADKVRKYAGSDKRVVVTLDNDKVLEGLLVSAEEDAFKVLTGKRGRPVTFGVDRIAKVVLAK